MAVHQLEDAPANGLGQWTGSRDPLQQRGGIGFAQCLTEAHRLSHTRLRREAREEQPAVFRREDAEQFLDRGPSLLTVRFFASLDNDEDAQAAAGFRGTVAGGAVLEELRAAKGVGQVVPRSTGVPVKSVEIEIEQAVRVWAVSEISGVLARDVFQGPSRQRRLPHSGRADDRSALAMAQTPGELRSLGVAAEELLGRQRQLPR